MEGFVITQVPKIREHRELNCSTVIDGWWKSTRKSGKLGRAWRFRRPGLRREEAREDEISDSARFFKGRRAKFSSSLHVRPPDIRPPTPNFQAPVRSPVTCTLVNLERT
jgi:hypothetical protein